MATVTEAFKSKTQMGATLGDGVDVVSNFQEITFTLYRKLTLPRDGFVFWVRGSIVNDAALLNRGLLNQDVAIVALPRTITARGSLHYATMLSQNEEQTLATNRVIFTSQVEVTDLNMVDPDVMYLAEIDGVRFSFSNRGPFYEQAGLWHYQGDAVYADLATQIVDDPSTFDPNQLVVSNSTPIWLAINSTPFEAWDLIRKPSAPLYASYLLPANAEPPFVSVHVDPNSTKSILAGTRMDRGGSSSQLCTESVRFTLTGMGNDAAYDLLDFLGQYTLNNPGVVGIMNSPAVRDDKRGQVELQTLAQRKFIDLEINYYQSRSRAIAPCSS